MGKMYIFEKVRFTKELKRLSRIAKRTAWDAIAKVVQIHSQL